MEEPGPTTPSAPAQARPPRQGEQAELELRRHFEGRRQGQRVNVALPVELVCVQRNLPAKTINISRSGALIEVLEHDGEQGMAELVRFCEEIDRLFAAGGTLNFQRGVTRTIEAVRVTAGGLGKKMAPLVACRFTELLTDADFTRIGIAVPNEKDVPPDTDADPFEQMQILGPVTDPTETRKVPAIQELLRWAVELEATDIHVKAGSPPRLRVNGILSAVGEEKLTDDETRAMVRNFLGDQQWEAFDRTGDLDLSFALEGIARFRINVLRSRERIAMILRRIPEVVPTVEELGLAPVCLTLSQRKKGLVLVTGGSGSGKTTTLAAMLRHINETRPCHIVTLEDPIEFVHEEIQAQITQRQIGRDTEDFACALKRVVRQDPDVIMVGEMRDLETIQLAVTAAETGHLVFATLHTTSAAQSVNRIVDVFPAEQQGQIRVQVAATLQAVISQTLVPKLKGGITVAQEVLVVTDAVRALIRDAKSPQLRNVMQTGAGEGMQTLEDSLSDLVQREAISFETAIEYANVPSRILAPQADAYDPPPPLEPEEPPPEEPVEEPAPPWEPERLPWTRKLGRRRRE
ncbi:MAG: PilT/PilU family type 4a pilus ATPase [Planctomycetota bacterium]|jgi:twitching motility protein PilT